MADDESDRDQQDGDEEEELDVEEIELNGDFDDDDEEMERDDDVEESAVTESDQSNHDDPLDDGNDEEFTLLRAAEILGGDNAWGRSIVVNADFSRFGGYAEIPMRPKRLQAHACASSLTRWRQTTELIGSPCGISGKRT
jgi:hypothetical protein